MAPIKDSGQAVLGLLGLRLSWHTKNGLARILNDQIEQFPLKGSLVMTQKSQKIVSLKKIQIGPP